MLQKEEANEGMSPRSQAKREQIIRAAQHLFLKNGYKRTSMEAIRLEAQVSKPTLYRHFDSKQNLFIGIMEPVLEEITAARNLVSMDMITISSAEQLRAILSQFASASFDRLMAPEMMSLARTLLAETRTFPELGRNFRERISLRVIKMLTAVLTTAHDQGVVGIEREHIPVAARYFAGQIISFMLIDGLLLGDKPPQIPSKKEQETAINLFLRMLG